MSVCVTPRKRERRATDPLFGTSWSSYKTGEPIEAGINTDYLTKSKRQDEYLGRPIFKEQLLTTNMLQEVRRAHIESLTCCTESCNMKKVLGIHRFYKGLS